jgi:2-polyprenyl-3-methyl-5-hydroxy-6-metoxy-1,4-benzoquinol methylase
MNIYQECKVCKSAVKVVNKTYNLGQCNQCKLIFCLTQFTQSEFVKVYDELYNKENAVYSNHSIVEYRMLQENKNIKIGYHRAKILKKQVFNGRCTSVLEIGSGIGLIGCYIKNQKDQINYTGIEIDKESYEKSQNLHLNTIHADFTVMENMNETFDVIMLWEVMEHLQDLNLFIAMAYKKLNSGGKVILSTPNYNKIYNYPSRELDAIYQDKPPVHLNFFTKKNITTVFEMKGFVSCNAKVKRFPYLEYKSGRFYIDFIKAIFNRYNGSTIYFEATK